MAAVHIGFGPRHQDLWRRGRHQCGAHLNAKTCGAKVVATATRASNLGAVACGAEPCYLGTDHGADPLSKN